jgi:hypothetical protein
MLKLREKKEKAELPPDLETDTTFRAGKIPWKVLVPLYKGMVEEGEQERKRRISQWASQSLKMSKLPPNMEAQEKRRK